MLCMRRMSPYSAPDSLTRFNASSAISSPSESVIVPASCQSHVSHSTWNSPHSSLGWLDAAGTTDGTTADDRAVERNQTFRLPTRANARHLGAASRGPPRSCREDDRPRSEAAFHSGALHLSGVPFHFSGPQEADETKPLPALPKRKHHRTPLWHRWLLLRSHYCGFSAFALGIILRRLE